MPGAKMSPMCSILLRRIIERVLLYFWRDCAKARYCRRTQLVSIIAFFTSSELHRDSDKQQMAVSHRKIDVTRQDLDLACAC